MSNSSTLLDSLAHDLAAATAHIQELQLQPPVQDTHKEGGIKGLKKRVGYLEDQNMILQDKQIDL